MSIDDLFDEIEGEDLLIEREESPELTEYTEFQESCERLTELAKNYQTCICLPDKGEKTLGHYVVPLNEATDEQIQEWVDIYCPHIGLTTSIEKVSREGIFNLVALKNSSLRIPIQKR